MTDHDHELDDFRHRFDRIHAATPGSEDAPPDLWHRVRAQVETTEEGTSAMSSISIPIDSIPVSNSNAPSGQHRFARYANLAATIALVFAVALGGWFAATRMNQPGSPEPRFAAQVVLPEESGNGVCDVESLTVDEAMAILIDPIGSLIPDIEDPVAEGYPAYWFNRSAITVPNAYWYMSQVYDIETYSVNFPEADFREAQPILNEYLDCIKYGTYGQVWRLTDPVSVQAQIAQKLPILRSEEDAREKMPSLLEEPAVFNTGFTGETKYLRVNPDQENTGYFHSESFLGFPGYAISPVTFLDSEGQTLIEADVFGNRVDDPSQEVEGSLNLIYGRSAMNNQWYVLDFFYPFSIPGFD